jgi:RNA polymerase sigma factor (sigma-70 family)
LASDADGSGLPEPDATLRKLCEGDPVAIKQITAWIRSVTHRYRDILGSDTQDIEQDTLISLLEAAENGSFEGKSRFRTYVYSYAQHKCIDRLRATKRRPAVPVEDLALVDQGPAPDHSVQSQDKRRQILAILSEMPPDCRELWQLLSSGASYRKMSERLGVSEGALRVRVLRCRRRAMARRDRFPDA